MFGETTISYVKNWNHPIETTTNKWMFGVPGNTYVYMYYDIHAIPFLFFFLGPA